MTAAEIAQCEMALRLAIHWEHCRRNPKQDFAHGFCQRCGTTEREWEQYEPRLNQAAMADRITE